MLSDRTLQHGLEAASALLAVDALYREESGDETGLVCLDMDAQGIIPRPGTTDYTSARAWWSELREKAAELPEVDRRLYYSQLAHSTLTFIDWRTGGLPFESQLGDFLHVPVGPVADARLEDMAGELYELLGAMGYQGDLQQRALAWEERVRVPADDVEAVLRDLMTRAWERTEERLITIPAPPSDGMTAKAVRNVAFNARCNYLERCVEINVDPGLTRPGLKHLAVHEGCPGHYVQFKLRETWANEGRAAADVLLSVVNTASSSVFEGIADGGMAMVDWVEDDDDRVQALLNHHRAAIGTGAAWRLHVEGWGREQATDWLSDQALVGGEGWVHNRIAFVEAPSRAVLIWTYWWGEQSVLPVWQRVPPARRLEFLEFLHGRMHSIQSLAMFDA